MKDEGGKKMGQGGGWVIIIQARRALSFIRHPSSFLFFISAL
jgi:hypothetical protein